MIANIGLAGVCFQPHIGDTPIVSPATASPRLSTANSTADSTAASEAAQRLPALINRLQTGDLATELEALRRLGLPEDTLKTLAEGVIMRRFREGLSALNKEGDVHYWLEGYAQTKEQRERHQKKIRLLNDLQEQARVAGIRWDMLYQNSAANFLPDEKARLVARIQRDHTEMLAQISMEAGGIMLERDLERRRYIDEEYQKDLAAALTPEELTEWKLRTSNTAKGLKTQLADMQPTKEEFQQIYRLQEAFDETWSFDHGYMDWQKRSEAEKALKTDIATLLGAERYADYTKSTDLEFGTLSNLEYRLELPAGTADRLYAMHAESDAAAKAIRENKQLSKDDQKTALKALANKVTRDMTDTLGAEGFDAYRNRGGSWINELRH